MKPAVRNWQKPITIARHAYGDVYKSTEYRVPCEGKAELLLTLARARAIENTSYVLVSSQPGPGRTGHSAIVDPRGVVLSQAGSDEVRTLHAALDPEVVRASRAQVPSLGHRRYRVVPVDDAGGRVG